MADELREALTAANASSLIQKQISPELLEYVRRYSPLVRAVPTKQWGSNTYYFNQRTALGAGGNVTDGGAVSVTTSTYAQSSFTIKLFQTIGSVTGYAQAVTRDLIGDLKQTEMAGALRGLLWDVEIGMLWGNAGATSSGSYPQMDGLSTLVSTYSGSTQNAIDEAGGQLSLSMVDNLIDLVEENAACPIGSDWMLVCSPKTNSKLASLQVSNQRFVNQVEVATGLNVMSYRDVPIIKSSFLAARSVTVGSATVAASSTGGTIASSVTTWYQVAPVISRFGLLQATTAVSSVSGSSTNTNANKITLPTLSGLPDGGGAILWAVYSGTAASSTSLLGYVDATDTAGVAVTTIADTGTNLLANSATATTGPTAYQGGNTGVKPRTSTSEDAYLIPRNSDFLVRPHVRDMTFIDLAPTTSAPDTLPFSIVSDTCLAVRGPKYVGRISNFIVTL